MRILDKGKGIIEIQDVNKNNVDFVMVDYVFFQRMKPDGDFINTSNNNINNYTVEILPTDNIFLELKISAKNVKSGKVFISTMDNQKAIIGMNFA